MDNMFTHYLVAFKVHWELILAPTLLKDVYNKLLLCNSNGVIACIFLYWSLKPLILLLNNVKIV
jgi:hypothetical protein